jgi:hypothetical protein
MTKSDVSQVEVLLRRYLERFDIIQTFGGEGEVEHWFTSGRGTDIGGGKREKQVVWAYVVEVTHYLSPCVSASRADRMRRTRSRIN